ncbi:MAG: sigma-70 family RNA polymerase sigma factor [Ruminococcus sp.]|nr:sigma-70 family RNA polymerase sigma factor [Ruminococcus sp.]
MTEKNLQSSPVPRIIMYKTGAAEYEDPPNDELIIRCMTDKDALERLFVQYKNDVFAFSLSLYNNRTIAEDCVGETFMRLPKAAKSYKKGASEIAFILGVAKNVSRELYRSEARFRAGAKRMEEDFPIDAAPQSGMLEIVRTLPSRMKVPIMLHLYSGMTFNEIAKLLGVPESTIKSRYQKAIRIISAKYQNDSNFYF